MTTRWAQHRRRAARLQPPLGQGAPRRPAAPAHRGQVPRGLRGARRAGRTTAGNTWLHIRVPMRPNGRTGLGARDRADGALHTVHTAAARQPPHAARDALRERPQALQRPHRRRQGRRRRRPPGTSASARSSASPARPIYGPRAIGTSAYAPHADRLARRRSRRPARHRPARTHPRAPVARLHPPAQPRHPHGSTGWSRAARRSTSSERAGAGTVRPHGQPFDHFGDR